MEILKDNARLKSNNNITSFVRGEHDNDNNSNTDSGDDGSDDDNDDDNVTDGDDDVVVRMVITMDLMN